MLAGASPRERSLSVGTGWRERPRRSKSWGDRLSALDKKSLSESDICDQMTQIRREVALAPGPVTVRGNVASRNKKKRKFADYILYQEPSVPIAVVESSRHRKQTSVESALT
jgi:hypothetical protein